VMVILRILILPVGLSIDRMPNIVAIGLDFQRPRSFTACQDTVDPPDPKPTTEQARIESPAPNSPTELMSESPGFLLVEYCKGHSSIFHDNSADFRGGESCPIAVDFSRD